MRTSLLTARALIFILAGIWGVTPALADKPEGKGGGKHEQKVQNKNKNKNKNRDDDGRDERRGRDEHSGRKHFDDRHAGLARDYYGERYRDSKKCPPGLAKKNNGCMPPGQAKKWHMGRALPRDVVYYQVPQPLIVQFPLPPRGYRYVRVADDILLINIGTRMVVDTIQINIGW